jgi:hypothetical protein
LTERNDQLDYSWKDGYEKGASDANAAKQLIKKLNLPTSKKNFNS